MIPSSQAEPREQADRRLRATRETYTWVLRDSIPPPEGSPMNTSAGYLGRKARDTFFLRKG
jgi:hypothetical protein